MTAVTDATAPRLQSLTIPTSIDLSSGDAGLTISGLATDDNSGVDQVVVFFDNSITYAHAMSSTSFGTYSLIGNFGIFDSWSDGSSSQTFKVAATNPGGTYNVTKVTVQDVQGNTRTYLPDELANMGINTAVTLFGSNADTTAPTLQSLSIPTWIDLSSGDAGLTISGLATDDNSGVDQVVVFFDNSITYAHAMSSTSFGTYSLIGNFGIFDSWSDGSSSQTFRIAATNPGGTYNVTKVTVQDVQGNTRTYLPNELTDLGVNTKIDLSPDGSLPSPSSEVTFTQAVVNDELHVHIFSAQQVTQAASLDIQFTYAAGGLAFNNVLYPGSASASHSSSIAGNLGSVSLTAIVSGPVSPIEPLATLVFEGEGSGSFDLNFVKFNIDGEPATYIDPPNVSYDIHPQPASVNLVLANGIGYSGVFNPFDDLFGPSLNIKTYPVNGSLSVDSGLWSNGSWSYVPAPGSSGSDEFVLVASDFGRTKELQVAVLLGTDQGLLTGTPSADRMIGSDRDEVFDGAGSRDFVDGNGGFDTVVFESAADSYRLGHSDGVWTVSIPGEANSGSLLQNIEELRFSDKTVTVEARDHAGYADLPESLWHFFIVAFDAAPGVTYMDQLADAYRYGLAVPEIVEIFTGKSQFSAVYPKHLSHEELAVEMVENIVKDSAAAPAKLAAVADIRGSLDLGWSVGEVVYTVFGNLANKPHGDPIWGDTALQFQNQIEVARYYTEVMKQSTDQLETLRSVIEQVTPLSDVSHEQALITLIGTALLDG